MNYVDVPVTINGATILATSASVEENFSIESVASLGSSAKGYGGGHISDRRGGTVSLSYYLQDGDSAIRALTGINVVDGTIGNTTFKSAVLSSYSMSVKPYSIVEVQANFSFFEGLETNVVNGAYSASDFSLMNGESSSVVDGVGFNNKVLSYSLNISQDIEPVYLLGEDAPDSYNRSNGKITIEIAGSGVPNFIDFPCSDTANTSLTIGSTCGGQFTITNDNMKIESISIESSVDNLLEGSVSLVKFF